MKSFLEKAELIIKSHWHYQSLKRTQFDRKKIEKIQFERLQKLLAHCFQNVKYYRELFQERGLTPESVSSIDDLRKVPILTKQQIRQRFWDFLPKELPRCRVYRTSGSTGVPICILSDESSRIHNSAAIIRYRKAYGMKAFTTAIITPLKKESELIPKPHWTYVQGFHKTYYVNPYTDNGDQIGLGVGTIESLSRPAIIGITPAVRALAQQIKDGVYPSIRPVAVLTVGQSLDAQTRMLLEDVFCANVYDTYACSEAGDIAWQCRESSIYHINAENCIFEVVGEDGEPVGDGEVGEVVVTNLNRYSMPFIRYKNGDLARASYEQCVCGRGLGVIGEIIGRSGEDIYIGGGKTVQWNVLKGVMNHNLIRQFQLIQNEDASLTVRYIPENAGKADEIESVLGERFGEFLPGDMLISYEVVGEIGVSASGKSKLVVCNYRGEVK